MKQYRINEIFYSIQGEGVRQGTANVFVRFSNCNLKCSVTDPLSGFDCDTNFTSGEFMTAEEILKTVQNVGNGCENIILTGGEPTLQIDFDLLKNFTLNGYKLALESNGTKDIFVISNFFEWICISPKSAEHTLRYGMKKVDEVKYVLRDRQSLPVTKIIADHYLISPAFDADGTVNAETLRWCIDLVKNNPKWRLSIQLHKFLGVR